MNNDSDVAKRMQLGVNMAEMRGGKKGRNVIHLHLAAMKKALSGLAEAEWRHSGSTTASSGSPLW